MVNAENDHKDVLAALRGAQQTELPNGLQRRLTEAADADRNPTAPWGSFEEHADEVYTYLVALVDDTAHAEELVVETFVRIGKKGEPTLAQLIQTARHAALEALAKDPGEASALSPADWALVSERRMGFSDEDLTRMWSQLPARLHERLAECGAALLAKLEDTHEGAGIDSRGAEPPGVPPQPPAAAALACPEKERLPLALLDLQGEPAAEAYAQHLETCSACAEWTALLEETMTPTPRTLPDGQRTRESVKKRLEPVPEQEIADLDIQVAVSCCYCHDRLGRTAAAFCATCLAPHHPDCFDEHGGCATPGCHGVQVVYPSDRGEQKPPTRKQRGWLVPGVIAMLVAGGVAAYSSFEMKTRSQDSLDYVQRLESGQQVAEADLTREPKSRGPRLLNLIEDTSLLKLPVGEYTIPYLLEGWAKARNLTPSVGDQAKTVRITLDNEQTLDREQLRTLLATQDLVLVIGPGESARVFHQRNVLSKIGQPSLIEGDTPVDPDRFVSRVVPIKNQAAGNTIFATLRGIMTRDTLRISNILYTQEPAALTIIDLARNVRYYEQMAAKLDQPAAPLPRARVELFHAPANVWTQLRDETNGTLVLGQLRERAAKARGRAAPTLLQSLDVDFAARTWNEQNITPIGKGNLQVEGRRMVLTLEALRPKLPARGISVILRSVDSGELVCRVPETGKAHVQAVLLSDGNYLVLALSGK